MEHRLFPTDMPLSRAAIDYPQLVATLSARQAASAIAQAADRLGRIDDDAPFDPLAALAKVARGQPGWAQAAGSLGSCFHPGVAARLRGGDSNSAARLHGKGP